MNEVNEQPPVKIDDADWSGLPPEGVAAMEEFGFHPVPPEQAGAPTLGRVVDRLSDLVADLEDATRAGDLGGMVDGVDGLRRLLLALDAWAACVYFRPDPPAVADADWPALEARLLAIGGDRVVARPEPHLTILLARGRSFAGSRARKVKGWDSQCHGNAVVHYLDSRGGLEIARGYGLSGDGLWRQHSWLWDGERVLETTVKRRVYYGVVLTPAGAARFVLGELPGLAPGMHGLLKDARQECDGRDSGCESTTSSTSGPASSPPSST